MIVSYYVPHDGMNEFDAGGALMEAYGDLDERHVLLITLPGQMLGLESYSDEVIEMIKTEDCLALYLPDDHSSVDDFFQLSPLHKLFVEGTEDQLSRKVAYIILNDGDEFNILEVPIDKAERWEPPSDAEEREVRLQTAIEAVRKRLGGPAGHISTEEQKETQ
jgi:hypothetical protein